MDPGFVKAKALMEMTISKGILEPPRTCSSSSDRQRRWRLLPHQPALQSWDSVVMEKKTELMFFLSAKCWLVIEVYLEANNTASR
jgi:hypothetical protein